MNCFNNLIGLKGVCDGNTVSMYLEQCGITSDMLAKVNYTHDDVKTLLTDKIDEATNIAAAQFKAVNAPYITTVGSLVADRVGHPSRVLTTVQTKTGYDAGCKIELKKDTDYIKIAIDSISLFVDNTGDVDVQIWDLTEGRLLDTVTISAVAGEMVYSDVNLSYNAAKRNMALGFLYNSTFDSYKTTSLPNQNCGSCASKDLSQSKYTKVAGVKFADGAQKTIDNSVYESDTSGISVTYTIQCDFDQWVCRNRDLLLLTCLYYSAYHIANYALMSTKLNSYSIDYRTTLETIRDMNLDNYNNEFSNVMKGMVLPQNSECFLCKNQASHPVTL